MRHSTYLEINLGLLAKNFNLIRTLAPKAEVIPMVKADAYGNGMIPISQFLVGDCGARVLGCASLGEAIYLMRECPDLKAEILVFSDTEMYNPEARDAYQSFNIHPVLHNKQDLDLYLKDKFFATKPVVIKINTGMNRLGLSEMDIMEYLPYLKNRGIEHLMTHFARSSQHLRPDDKTHRQFSEFIKIKKNLIDAGIEVRKTSVANSGAIEQQYGIEETYVRPGLMLYGPPSVTEPIQWNGNQISRWVSRVISTFQVKKGTPVGYGVNVADKDSFMAILPIGYGDGFLTYFSGTKIKINGIEGKIFGRINMDMTFVQFDPAAENKIKNGDLVEIWNNDNRTINDLAVQSGTHAYQLMCAVSNRIPRIYKVK